MEKLKRHYVYMLRCADDTLYTGYTTDPKRRLEEHNRGVGAKYTRARLPVALVYLEEGPNKSWGLRREAAIKKLCRRKKLELIEKAGDPFENTTCS